MRWYRLSSILDDTVSNTGVIHVSDVSRVIRRYLSGISARLHVCAVSRPPGPSTYLPYSPTTRTTAYYPYHRPLLATTPTTPAYTTPTTHLLPLLPLLPPTRSILLSSHRRTQPMRFCVVGAGSGSLSQGALFSRLTLLPFPSFADCAAVFSPPSHNGINYNAKSFLRGIPMPATFGCGGCPLFFLGL